MIKSLVGVFLFTSVFAQSVWAVPGQNEAYRDDHRHLLVFKDSTDPTVFWYVPLIRPYMENGQMKIEKAEKPDGTINYYFYLLPYFPDELKDFLAHEIPGLHNFSQLKPVIASKFAIQSEDFKILAISNPMTNYSYIDNPQLVRFNLSKADSVDFDTRLNATPGIPVDVFITYASDRVTKSLKVELNCKNVYDAMNIDVTGKYMFSKAEISNNITNYMATHYLIIESKGDIRMPDVVDKSIQACFTMSIPGNNYGGGGYGGYHPWWSVLPMDRDRAIEKLLWDIPGSSGGIVLGGGSSTYTPYNPFPPSNPSTPGHPTGPGATDDGAQFVFKKDAINQTNSFYFGQTQLDDFESTVVVSSFFSNKVDSTSLTPVITELPEKKADVPYTASLDRPSATGIKLGTGDQWTLNAAFVLSAKVKGEVKPLKWDPSWPNVYTDLYYRVGDDGQWMNVGENGRALLGTDSIYKGEIQFYLDRAKIWSKVPSEYKDSWAMGLVPPILDYQDTYPEFHVTFTGRHVDLK